MISLPSLKLHSGACDPIHARTDVFCSISNSSINRCAAITSLCPGGRLIIISPRSRRRRRSGRTRSSEGAANSLVEDEWMQKLPEKKKPLYSHSLPCIEAWLRSLGFVQNKEDRAVWLIERPDWHARLSLDITDLYIRYLKSGPGKLERDMERKFSYALSREDLENAILGGP